ncbi:MAG: VOC family protein [Gemmatimonadaceae bacterium]|nr:VOC family protein [Gemmatimonadaceae bacterium]
MIESSFDALVYAKSLDAVAACYASVLGVAATDRAPTHARFAIDGGQLWIHAIPAAYAAAIQIDTPPSRREDAAVKLSFFVPSLAQARDAVLALGGGADGADRAWAMDGLWHLDAWDCEGNVFQMRAPSP